MRTVKVLSFFILVLMNISLMQGEKTLAQVGCCKTCGKGPEQFATVGHRGCTGLGEDSCHVTNCPEMGTTDCQLNPCGDTFNDQCGANYADPPWTCNNFQYHWCL